MSRQVKTLAMGAALSLVAAAFSYALPGVVFTANLDPVQQLEEVEDPDPTPSPSPTEEEEEEDDENGDPEAGGHRDNHGAVVSTAAKCPIKGRAHGELVRSIARDKSATVDDAEAACDEALAAQESAGGASSSGRSGPEGVKPRKERQSQSSSASSTGSGTAGDGEGSTQSTGGKKGGPQKSSQGKGSGQGKGRP